MYANGDDEGTVVELKANKVYSIGRETDNDIRIEYGAITRHHCKIYYDEKYGWLIEDLNSTSGTWLHPKTFTKCQLQENSLPVLLRNEMILKVHSFTMQFHEIWS